MEHTDDPETAVGPTEIRAASPRADGRVRCLSDEGPSVTPAGTTAKFPPVVARHMGEKKFTLFELHIDGDTQVGPRALPDAILGGWIDGETSTEDDADETAAAEEDSGGRGAIAAVVGLIALVAIALVVRKFRAGDEEPATPADERDVVVS